MTSGGGQQAGPAMEMEEKEQLRQQIRLLQGLIDDYKNVHGNSRAQPAAAAGPRWPLPAYRGRGTFGVGYPRPVRGDFFPHRGLSWRKKYSLVNRPPGAAEQPEGRAPPSQDRPGPSPPDPPRRVRLGPDQNVVVGIEAPSDPGSAGGSRTHRDVPRSDPGLQKKEGGAGASNGEEDADLVCRKERGDRRVGNSAGSGPGGPGEPRRTVSENARGLTGQAPPARPRSSEGAAGGKAGPPVPDALRLQRLRPGREPPLRNSLAQAPLDVSGPGRRAPATRTAREPSLPGPCRTPKFKKTNYTWVASTVKAPRGPPRRSLSPRAAAEAARRAPSTGAADGPIKPQPKADPAVRPRKPAAPSKPGGPSSKYRWKAAGPTPATAAAFQWRAEAPGRSDAPPASPDRADLPAPSQASGGPSGWKPAFGETALSAYKVKSRTKIIKRRGSVSLPGDKKSSLLPPATPKSHYSLRRKHGARAKSSPVLKKNPNRGLVQVTKHRLRRLPAARAHTPGKEGSSIHTFRSPLGGKVIKTRYRIVKKNVASSAHQESFGAPSPSWRTRRLSSPRSLVLNQIRHSPFGGKSQQAQQRWRSRGYRCIGGIMYRVSANKLSKTYSIPLKASDGSTRYLSRTGKLDSPSSSSSPGQSPSCSGRAATSRSIASRAVQRSLAIIRQARQRKEKKKDYCMYYNRFGRCNRGLSCPYIHDPDKVAVCTRFLRGTCKKTDGSCPFSHKVSKDKMPVCSYFLKGICSNSNCPYSHVYVSRKAEVCQDFLKGYCPMGEKCKKKHTLLCPDFAKKGSCPRGGKCKLLHRQRKRQSQQSSPTDPLDPSVSPAPWRRGESDGAERQPAPPCCAQDPPGPSSPDKKEPSQTDSEGPGSSTLQKLPSFISLQSPVNSRGRAPIRAKGEQMGEDTGKPLQIKPRL
uniref:Zinc finger CCCH domain-containing protein 3 n=2 Tax=Ornithorhynchus anatinus TaxID=9258 RepID=F7FCN5_ORNAN